MHGGKERCHRVAIPGEFLYIPPEKTEMTMLSDNSGRTLRNLLWRSAELYSERAALAMVETPPVTYASLLEQVQGLSRFLHDRGIIAGDRVAILAENMPNWGIAFFSITTMGAIAVPILPDFHATEIHHILRHSEAKGAFVSRRLFPKLEDAETPTLSTTILMDDFTLIPPRTRRDKLAQLLEQGSREFAKLKEAALKLAGRIPETVNGDDLAVIIYTSGTTGHSKGVMLTHSNIVSDVMAVPQVVAITKEDRLLSILPLSHTYECTLGLVAPLYVGASVFYLDRPPTAAALLPALAKIRPTIMLSVPLVIEKMFKTRIHPQLTAGIVRKTLYSVPILRKQMHRRAGKKLLEAFGGQLRIFTIGGAPLAPDVELFLREASFPYAIGYGLTETAPLVAGTGPGKTRYRSTGFPIPGTQIRIDQPDPSTGEGEILIKGPMVMKGYFKDPERTAEVLTHDGWFRSGDLGVFDKKGYLYIKGRLKNMILGPNGKNIYPEELESLINEFDLVLESLVYELEGQLIARIHPNYEEIERLIPPSERSDSQIRARIPAILESLQTQINHRFPSYARIHRIIEQREPFEKTPTQKIKRHLYVPRP
jgi:long-chain acyl-CoA synthetase